MYHSRFPLLKSFVQLLLYEQAIPSYSYPNSLATIEMTFNYNK